MREARIAAAILLGVMILSANERPAIPEYEVKAAHVFNFTKFFEWPKNDSVTSMTICVFGNDPFRTSLEDVVRDKQVHGTPGFGHRRRSQRPSVFDTGCAGEPCGAAVNYGRRWNPGELTRHAGQTPPEF